MTSFGTNTAITVTQGDTTPGILLSAYDPIKGALMNLATAEKVELFLKGAKGGKIHGTCKKLEPAIKDEEEIERNLEYEFGATDTSVVDVYTGKIKITWSAGKVQWVPGITMTVEENEE